MGIMRLFRLMSAAAFAAALGGLWLTPAPPPASPLAVEIAVDALPAPRTARYPLPVRLAAAGFAKGEAAFLRIFKEEQVLEVWLKDGAAFRLFETWPICFFSGGLGPKLQEGDRQAPEGFYEIGRAQLNPNSAYHLAFNLGYPNAYDRAHGRTGAHLMVHGACVSVGCYAMTDAGIEDIYGLVAAALERGQRSVSVHIFPFRMSEAALAAHAGGPWDAFWANLKEGYDAFEATYQPPAVHVCDGRYAFGAAADRACKRVASW